MEVNWTSGGIDKLAIYARLNVPEVGVWKEGATLRHVPEGATYREATTSVVLPGIDLGTVAELLDAPRAGAAIEAYRSLEG